MVPIRSLLSTYTVIAFSHNKAMAFIVGNLIIRFPVGFFILDKKRIIGIAREQRYSKTSKMTNFETGQKTIICKNRHFQATIR